MKPVELHLPDLPEVPLALTLPGQPAPAGAAPRRAMSWHLRLGEALGSYLPLLLMALLALASWWLVKNAPRPPGEAPPRVVSDEPDYVMNGFALERFGADGRLLLRIQGRELRHLPASDRIEIDGATIQAWSPEGRLTVARAERAGGPANGRELHLEGAAEVRGEDAAGVPFLMQGESLHAFFDSGRVRSERPVRVRHGSTELRAAGLDYDHAGERLQLTGPLRVQLTPREAVQR
jgi:lipopolysaccharide export system protein LptC